MNGIGTVCAAMSGGVDSSVTAYLLQSAEFNVFGATMRLYRPEQNVTGQAEPQPCGSDRDINDARAVCDLLCGGVRIGQDAQPLRAVQQGT